MKVLIVDDNEALTLVLQEMLEDEDYETRTARDGEDGYLAYLHFRPDLVITDIQMPRKDGFQLMKDIRIHNPKIETIYMTGGGLRGFRSRFEEEKTRYQASFLKKPFSRVELMSCFLRC